MKWVGFILTVKDNVIKEYRVYCGGFSGTNQARSRRG